MAVAVHYPAPGVFISDGAFAQPAGRTRLSIGLFVRSGAGCAIAQGIIGAGVEREPSTGLSTAAPVCAPHPAAPLRGYLMVAALGSPQHQPDTQASRQPSSGSRVSRPRPARFPAGLLVLTATSGMQMQLQPASQPPARVRPVLVQADRSSQSRGLALSALSLCFVSSPPICRRSGKNDLVVQRRQPGGGPAKLGARDEQVAARSSLGRGRGKRLARRTSCSAQFELGRARAR